MYAYIKGRLMETDEDNVVVETGGIGYNIKMAAEDISSLPAVGSEVRLYTYTSVREDAIWLYGFPTREELTMFKLLITVSGIGPKGAQAVLSAIRVEDLRYAIYTGDVKKIAKAPGIGAKTAQRMVLDLKDKISFDDVLGTESRKLPEEADAYGENRKEAMEALTALGYAPSDAAKVINAVPDADKLDVEQLLKAALKQLAFL
ncbi:MAG: Holliday junction branch migration protein RuvA [Lachnospiraceae bacterium]|nr:Holliday junction branch migration protein RuvA [Lachnospiraceae bacterium]